METTPISPAATLPAPARRIRILEVKTGSRPWPDAGWPGPDQRISP
jgi:hypothetical protein